MAKKVGVQRVFQYQINNVPARSEKQPTGTPIVDRSSAEQFTGQINGLKASDIEERFDRALRKNPNIINYEFRAATVAGRNLPGEVEVDFMVDTGTLKQPVQIDGEFAHKTQQQKESDAMKDAILNDFMQGYAFPVVRIPYLELSTQDAANRVVKELFGG